MLPVEQNKVSEHCQVITIGSNLSTWYTCIYQSLLNFFSPTCPKAKYRKKNSIYSNKFFRNFHLSESSFTCPGLRASELVRN